MSGFNKAILTGRLTADPEVRYTDTQKPVVHFTLAILSFSKNGEKDAQFIPITAWNGLAKICGEYLKKGRLVGVEGRLDVSRYEKNGEPRYRTEVVADNVHMLDFPPKAKKAEEAPAETVPA